MQKEAQRKCIAIKYIENIFPTKLWTHANTDGSAKEATENGGGGVISN
jgi:hypothetical protein